MDPHHAFRRLREDMNPAPNAQKELKGRIMARIQEPATLAEWRESLTPDAAAKATVWNRVRRQIAAPGVRDAFGRVRDALQPEQDVRRTLWSYVSARLAPQPAAVTYRVPKWAAAFAIVLVGLRASPILFLAPRTIAESSIIILPTSGDVSIALHQLWQPVEGETEIREPVEIRTGDGEATVILHDDGNIRLAPHTTVILNDVSDRPDPVPEGPTFTLVSGSVWMQGLLPSSVDGIALGTDHGTVMVHGGSVSVTAGDTVDVRVWNRNANVSQTDVSLTLIAGETTALSAGVPSVQKIPASAYAEDWAVKNLKKDAVHQREIAQMQQERRAAQAGILPNSPLYGVKRIAETMDVLLTLNPEEKVQKKIQQATTRLNEAAALIASGESGATVPLKEYKQTLLEVATGTGDSLTNDLVQKEVEQNAAQIFAVLPNDGLYEVKKAVLETTAELPNPTIDKKDVDGTVLVDTLDMLQDVVQEGGDTTSAKDALAAIAPQLNTLNSSDDSALKPDVKKEALSLLSDLADTLNSANEGTGSTVAENDAILKNVRTYLPKPASKPVVKHMTEEEIGELVAAIKARVFLYKQPRSRYSQLINEMQRLVGNPDEGSILRALYHELPENGLAIYVRTAIQELRERQKLIDLHPAAPEAESGSTAQ